MKNCFNPHPPAEGDYTLDEFVEKLQGKSHFLAEICKDNIGQWRRAKQEKRDFPLDRSREDYEELKIKELQATAYLRGIIETLYALGKLEWRTRCCLADILINGEES